MELDLQLASDALGVRPTRWERTRGGGYTQSHTWNVSTADGPAFVKQAEDAGSLEMLRREALVYESVRGAFIPGFVGFADSGTRALLAIELLDDAHWPPPYPHDVAPLLDALSATAATAPPRDLPAHGPWHSRWKRVEADPEPLLGLRVCSRAWLDESIALLVAAEESAEFVGDRLVHNDIYAANVAFTSRGAVLVDWGAAVRGSPWIDTALALLSVRVEGGTPPPSPEGIAPYVAAFAGHLAVEAPSPLPDWAEPGSTLRADMAGDLVHALAWCAELLELAPLP